MHMVGNFTGRHYSLFEYYGDPNAHSVIILMGSAAEVAQEYLDYVAVGKTDSAKQAREELHGGKIGFVNVKLYRPWSPDRFMKCLPETVKHIAVLDRVKEANANGDPLYVDVLTTLRQYNKEATVIGGRYGLSSKDFTPQMCHAVFLNLLSETPRHPFTVGIIDDVSNTSLKVPDTELDTAPEGTRQCVCWGLGSDGTVSANKIAIKIIGKNTDLNTQGFFVYDANKFGCLTTSHLRFGKEPTKAP
jgi:pyruvate-ferredoxin/flavodoxin oxidoreductase